MKRYTKLLAMAVVVAAGFAYGETIYLLDDVEPRTKLFSNKEQLNEEERTIADRASTSNSVWIAAGVGATGVRNCTISYPQSPNAIGKKVYQLSSLSMGRTIESIQPQYYLGEAVVPPDDVDWVATKAAFDAAVEAKPNLARQMFFDASRPAIYFAAGGVITIPWIMKDGTENEVSYVIATVSSSRPKRIFWTDYPYNAPPINLTGKFVRFFGAEGILTNKIEEVKEIVSGVPMTSTNVVEGLYFDKTTSLLYAKGELQGQVLMAYYDSGSYNRLLDVIVLEIARPDVTQITANVGDLLLPSGGGFGIQGLNPVPTRTEDDDGFGQYLYQHLGQETYSPKNNAVFSIRPTKFEDRIEQWRAEIYWQETDSQGVAWPFERSHYTCGWPENTPNFVRAVGNRLNPGTPIVLPEGLTAELMKYQNPARHAHQVDINLNAFTTYENGIALLKLIGTNKDGLDDIWFQPIRSVSNVDTNFVGDATLSWAIGNEVKFDSAAAGKKGAKVDATLSGYIYEPNSGDNYHQEFYYSPTDAIHASNAGSAPTSPSVIHFVNTTEDDSIEVWWSTKIQQEGMPSHFAIPTYVQRYSARWPEINEAQQIVLASQLGSNGDSLLFNATGAVERVTNEVIETDGSPAVVYVQNNDKLPGYNPNEEHALTMTGSGGYTVWALRSDLNTDESSAPGVLVQYTNTIGRASMQFYHVLPTNELYTAFEGEMTVGQPVPGPHPLDMLPNPWMPQTYWSNANSVKSGWASPGFRDRKGVIWARQAGKLPINWYYPMQDGFWFPSLKANEQPPVGTAIPWQALMKNKDAKVLTGEPMSWNWTASWPKNLPEMPIGKTLTTAEEGLPEVWNAKSLSILYPNNEETTALLFDPTVKRVTGIFDKNNIENQNNILGKLNFTTGEQGNIIRRNGKVFFKGLPPGISKRFYIDLNADTTNCISFIGELEKPPAGAAILHVNILNGSERKALKDLVSTNSVAKANKDLWDAAINYLAVEPQISSSNKLVSTNNFFELKDEYLPVDHYALSTLGGTNYVVLVENNATNKLTGVKEGDPISMHVFKVVPKYYTGRLVTREDPLNLLSEQLDVLYTESFAGKSQDFIFQWKWAHPAPDGIVPTDGGSPVYNLREGTKNGDGIQGLTRFTVGAQGATLADMVNTFHIMRYKAREGTKAHEIMGNTWSDWCYPALAEGWVQRVMNNITPFTQRMNDLYENPVESDISMLQQIGGPYQGDVALNQENLTNIGLIQLYQTILNRAESLSLLQKINMGAANEQLLLAVERLSDLYTILGNEARSDALNPTVNIGTGLTGNGIIDYSAEASSLFCFDNQVPSLLDEELALLRGRAMGKNAKAAPPNNISPYYNRLIWNFTRGITAGEVAYALNYNISGNSAPSVDANEAALMYPQGHGDAWGHYLSALKGWYRLLRNPFFSWGTPSQSVMLVGDSIVNVDYYDEARFAETAANLAQTSVYVFDRTARQVWQNSNATSAINGYEDAVPARAFGYGEWATRGGLAAFYNWVAVNSLLPPATLTNEVGVAYEDLGMMHIDRGSTPAIATIATAYDEIQRKLDSLDAGLNPLGLSERAIQFDIAPAGAADGTSSHFDQAAERAEVALANANKILERAQTEGSRIRMLQEYQTRQEDALEEQERSYNDQLISIYGYPYSGDIGPGGTYAQGYDGPDLFNYLWVDLNPFGFNELSITNAFSITYRKRRSYGDTLIHKFEEQEGNSIKITQQFTANGLIKKPNEVSGRRRAMGEIQHAYIDFIQNYIVVNNAIKNYNRSIERLNEVKTSWTLSLAKSEATVIAYEFYHLYKMAKVPLEVSSELAKESLSYAMALGEVIDVNIDNSVPETIGGGLAVIFDPSAAVSTVLAAPRIATKAGMLTLQYNLNIALIAATKAGKFLERAVEMAKTAGEFADAVTNLRNEVQAYVNEVNARTDELQVAWAGMLEAKENIETIVAKGERLLEEREMHRQQAANNVIKSRYNDMFFRIQQNSALSRYNTAFDIAQKYVWLAAKAYDYETALLSANPKAGGNFLREIIGKRTIGAMADGESMLSSGNGDGGLSDVLARMKANWQVLKPRLGINNPEQVEARWFSLRSQCFRISPSTAGDAAWRTELSKYYVEDLRSHSDYKRYCQPIASQNGLRQKEPALVIPFSTTIDFAQNFFGQPLAGGDAAFSSSYFATKIAASGIHLQGYNKIREGSSANAQLSQTPEIYLIPAGDDKMRIPGTDGETVQSFKVIDQVIPVPYPIGSSHLDDPTWQPLFANYTDGGDISAVIRKYPAITPSTDETGKTLTSTRLIGRSVWNTRWLLVIPAGSLGANRETALETLIYGRDTDYDGITDQLPLNDIQIGFRTYANSGN